MLFEQPINNREPVSGARPDDNPFQWSPPLCGGFRPGDAETLIEPLQRGFEDYCLEFSADGKCERVQRRDQLDRATLFANRLDGLSRWIANENERRQISVRLFGMSTGSGSRLFLLGGVLSVGSGKFLLPVAPAEVDLTSARQELVMLPRYEVLSDAAGIVEVSSGAASQASFIFTRNAMGCALDHAALFGKAVEFSRGFYKCPYVNHCPVASVLADVAIFEIINECYSGKNPDFDYTEPLGVSRFRVRNIKAPTFEIGLAVRDLCHKDDPEGFGTRMKVVEHLHSLVMDVDDHGVPALTWLEYKECDLHTG